MALDNVALLGLAVVFILAVVVFGTVVIRAVAAVGLALAVGYVGVLVLRWVGFDPDWSDVTAAWDWVVVTWRQAEASA